MLLLHKALDAFIAPIPLLTAAGARAPWATATAMLSVHKFARRRNLNSRCNAFTAPIEGRNPTGRTFAVQIVCPADLSSHHLVRIPG